MFMFSNPMFAEYKCPSKTIRNKIPRLNFKSEFAKLKSSVLKSGMEINLYKEWGTFENFETFLNKQKPSALHISGHGFLASYIMKELKDVQKIDHRSDKMIDEQVAKGDALVLEKPDCSAQYLHSEDLATLLK